ncbi:MAG TPA: hypothetical protein DEP99_04140, partial [Nitrospiraceae bacterium]|nr:hypothetical protein [Nitrospiraceae bacterium]
MSVPYLITFRPIDRFFFGTSHSFAEGFFAESMKYPQPTTILGCLRNTILIQQNIVIMQQNGRYIPDITANSQASRLTGTSKINGLNDNDDNFGVIERLSPVFIVTQKNSNMEDILFPVPAEVERNGDFFRYVKYEKKDNAISSYSGIKKDFAIDRDPKLYPSSSLGGKDFWNAYIDNKQLPYNSDYAEDKAFITHTSVGIGRENRVAKPGMFYTKIDYSFKEGYSFGVLVWLSNGNVLKDSVITMGGEQSV